MEGRGDLFIFLNIQEAEKCDLRRYANVAVTICGVDFRCEETKMLWSLESALGES